MELAVTINGKLHLITDTNLLDMDYLSESDPFEATLKNYLYRRAAAQTLLGQNPCPILDFKSVGWISLTLAVEGLD